MLVDLIYQEIVGFNLTHDRMVYNRLNFAYVEHGDIEKAISLRHEIASKEIELDNMT